MSEGLGELLKTLETLDCDLATLNCDNGLKLVLARSPEAGDALQAGVNKLIERKKQEGHY